MELYRGARQLQAPVWLRTDNQSSDPALALLLLRPRRRLSNQQRKSTGQDGPLLGADQRPSAPHATGLSLDSALGSNRPAPTDAGSD